MELRLRGVHPMYHKELKDLHKSVEYAEEALKKSEKSLRRAQRRRDNAESHLTTLRVQYKEKLHQYHDNGLSSLCSGGGGGGETVKTMVKASELRVLLGGPFSKRRYRQQQQQHESATPGTVIYPTDEQILRFVKLHLVYTQNWHCDQLRLLEVACRFYDHHAPQLQLREPQLAGTRHLGFFLERLRMIFASFAGYLLPISRNESKGTITLLGIKWAS